MKMKEKYLAVTLSTQLGATAIEAINDQEGLIEVFITEFDHLGGNHVIWRNIPRGHIGEEVICRCWGVVHLQN